MRIGLAAACDLRGRAMAAAPAPRNVRRPMGDCRIRFFFLVAC